MHDRAGQLARPDDLVDLAALERAYFDIHPDVSDPTQRVSFGTSGHRGSSLDGAFNERHVLAMSQAIADYRASHDISGPVLVGRDTHALSGLAWRTTVEVMAGNGVEVHVDARGGFTPTPAVSHAILKFNRRQGCGRADGIVITPSHNPPRDGGFKYNPPGGGPAGSDATSWIAARTNVLLEGGLAEVRRMTFARATVAAGTYDFLAEYVGDLPQVLDLDAVRTARVRIAADPMGGASVAYWTEIADRHDLDLTVVNDTVDPQWSFMPLDADGQIRMDCSSASSMASLVQAMEGGGRYDIATGNDADADRHGIVTSDGGLMNPNHYLAVAISYLFTNRAQWGRRVGIGKTLVSSSMIDRVASDLGRSLIEVPVGFKYFVSGLLDGTVGFGGEESAGASFLRKDGTVWTTDKDGILLALLAAEIKGATGRSPSELYADLAVRHGAPAYARIDAPASRQEKARLSALEPGDVRADSLAGERIIRALTRAPGNNEPIGGLKVMTENAWFAARPSGTENVYKIYAESFRGEGHLREVQAQARDLVDGVLTG